MLQADYEKLPSYEIPAAVQNASEEIRTPFGDVTHYPFPEGHINLWWRDHGELDARMTKLMAGRSEWNRGGFSWHVSAEHAPAVLADIRAL